MKNRTKNEKLTSLTETAYYNGIQPEQKIRGNQKL